MGRAFIIEDNSSDLRESAGILRKLGFEEVDAVNNVPGAILRLQDAAEGKGPAPDLILLDLAFTRESGFEVLRYWKTNMDRLRHTRIVVWTQMGDTEQQLCRYFGVDVVPKWAGLQALEQALRQSASPQPHSVNPQ